MTAGKHVLYIDDETALVEVMQQVLSRAGYRVTACTSAALALAHYVQTPAAFDLVLSDYKLPGMSGMALCREILRLRPTQRVALVSGHISDAERSEATRAGIHYVLEKPLTIAGALRFIEKALREPQSNPG